MKKAYPTEVLFELWEKSVAMGRNAKILGDLELAITHSASKEYGPGTMTEFSRNARTLLIENIDTRTTVQLPRKSVTLAHQRIVGSAG